MNLHVRNALLSCAPLIAFTSPVGLALAMCVAATLYWIVPRLNERENRKQTKVSATHIVDVLEGLTLCLSAGLSIPQSMKYVGASRETLAHQQLLSAHQVYEFGQDLPSALRQLARADQQWTLICGILSSAHLSGAPVVASFDSLLEYLREEAQSEISTRIRSLAVKCVLPLGMCFLPAFLLLTVVPLVAQFIAQMHW
jgi:pilus assembly protein TadC